MARKNAITAELARFAAGVDYGNLPREVTERVKALVLDLTGIIIRARFDADPAPALMTTVQQLGLGGGNCTVLGEPAALRPAGCRADQWRTRPFAGLRRYARTGLDTSERADRFRPRSRRPR